MNYLFKSKNGRYRCFPQFYGVYPEALEKLGYELKEGKYLEEHDKEYSIVVGENFAYRFYDSKKKRNNRIDPYPDASGKISQSLILGLAFVESLCIYALLVDLILLFVKL